MLQVSPVEISGSLRYDGPRDFSETLVGQGHLVVQLGRLRTGREGAALAIGVGYVTRLPAAAPVQTSLRAPVSGCASLDHGWSLDIASGVHLLRAAPRLTVAGR